MNRIFVTPALINGEPLKVRKPVNGYLDPKGEEVNAEGYWLRRVADGDVTQSEVPAAAPAADTGKGTARAIK